MNNELKYNNPIKIIHKFKNNNRRIQYHLYIFIGSLIDDEIINILDSIKKKTFFETINLLTKNKIEKLKNHYGEYWYQCFFNKYHLESQFNFILKNNNKQSIIESKMGKEWINIHLNVILKKKIEYSFASNYYDYLIARNKIKTQTRKVEMDFRTYNFSQLGGDEDEDEMNMEDQEMNMIIKDKDEDEEDERIMTFEDLDDEVVENFDLEELTKLYSMDAVEQDSKIKETSKLISEATRDKMFVKNSIFTELNYEDNLDDLTYDIKLEDVYEKYYIKDEFIFIDDNIKTIRNKICVSIPLSDKFGTDIKLLPEYQYLWTEYNLKNSIDYVMLGQKWIRKNELVKVDIRPNENLAVYENLRNNLNYLKDSFGIKIKREDDENNILRDYEDYFTNREIYMLDIVNELGLNYKVESDKKRNIYEVYVNIYYPLITFERFENIINLLNNTNTKELDYNTTIYTTIRNDSRLEKEIYNIVEETKLKSSEYNKYFMVNHIIQSIIHINLINPKNLTGTISQDKFNLYKIFDNFITSEEYPFIQYMTSDSNIVSKFYTIENTINEKELVSRWFENASYGLSFKIKDEKIDNKYISINMSETGRLEYKITWKEDDNATIDDIKTSYVYVNNLLLKINQENKKIKIILPDDSMFKYAFINTIQKFIIPNKLPAINHNDLSDFCRFFYTYVSLVIEPKKRLANISSKISHKEVFSKFGTYLRYKRISNYENKTKMHLRILYFLRNFEIPLKELIDEISKQFNITQELAVIELDNVKTKYGKVLNKTHKKLRKLSAMPKSKPPGIGIDIQGRQPDNYKIRITGARSKEQLNEIVFFIKVLLYLYIETYLVKNPKYQKIKETLLKLTKIAKRRNKVNEYVTYDTDNIKVKQITGLDKKRLGFKPEEGQSQWTRSCQNSGDDKKRRPIIKSNDNVKDLLKIGYKINKNGIYEKTSIITVNGKKKSITVKAIKLAGENNSYNYFTCDPDENAEHSYIGFLSKSNNPNDLCMPCCFKKDQADSKNKKKKNYYMNCIGQTTKTEVEEQTNDLGDKLYILQDTNKIQDGRYIFLPKYLNQFFNVIWKNVYVIKNHYLIESKTGYFFKYTVKDNNYYFLGAIAHIYNITIDQIKSKAIELLEKDKNNNIFTFLNNGDIRTQFKDRNNYIKYLKNSTFIEYDIIGELIGLPNCISTKGIIYYIFDKKIKIIKKNLEKDEYIENYYLQCLNTENQYYINNDCDIVILIKDGKYYFPIYRVKKDSSDKKIILQKIFNKNINTKIIDELIQYYHMSCLNNFIYKINNKYNITAKTLESILEKDSESKYIKMQVIDDRNKVIYTILDNGLILPTIPSGSILSIPIITINELKLLDLDTTIQLLYNFNKTHKILDYLPKILLYSSKVDEMYQVNSIYLVNQMLIPVKNINLKSIQFKKYGLSYEFQPIEQKIDNEIRLYVENKTNIHYDKRYINVKNRIYRNEAYNLFRLELSIYLENNSSMKDTIINIVRNKNINKNNKKKELLNYIISIIEGKIKNKKMLEIIKELPNLLNYQISNVREYCKINKTKDQCDKNLHCTFINKECMFVMYKNDIMESINKIVEEMLIDGIKFKEIIQEDTYYVSDIVDYTQYSNRPNQKIIKTTNLNIKKIMEDLFGKDSIPTIGRKHLYKNINDIEENYPDMIELGKQLMQEIIPNQNSIIRAYVNSYYWMQNNLYDKDMRNLKYFSDLQNMLTNLFKANIIDYITTDIQNVDIKKELEKYFDTKNNIFTSTLNRFRKNNNNTDGIVELTILSYIFPYPIVIYENYNNVKYIFSNGKVDVNEKTIKKYTNENEQYKTIFLKFEYEGNNNIPNKIYSIYYMD
jgi:hypothetical protein